MDKRVLRFLARKKVADCCCILCEAVVMSDASTKERGGIMTKDKRVLRVERRLLSVSLWEENRAWIDVQAHEMGLTVSGFMNWLIRDIVRNKKVGATE